MKLLLLSLLFSMKSYGQVDNPSVISRKLTPVMSHGVRGGSNPVTATGVCFSLVGKENQFIDSGDIPKNHFPSLCISKFIDKKKGLEISISSGGQVNKAVLTAKVEEVSNIKKPCNGLCIPGMIFYTKTYRIPGKVEIFPELEIIFDGQIDMESDQHSGIVKLFGKELYYKSKN